MHTITYFTTPQYVGSARLYRTTVYPKIWYACHKCTISYRSSPYWSDLTRIPITSASTVSAITQHPIHHPQISGISCHHHLLASTSSSPPLCIRNHSFLHPPKISNQAEQFTALKFRHKISTLSTPEADRSLRQFLE